MTYDVLVVARHGDDRGNCSTKAFASARRCCWHGANIAVEVISLVVFAALKRVV